LRHRLVRKWNALSNFARNLHVPENKIMKVKQDFDKLFAQWNETLKVVKEKHKSEKWEKSLSTQVFHLWDANLYCFFELILSGCRHVALRELRYYLDASVRSYYIDSNHQELSYNCKVSILKEVRWKKFRELIESIKEKRKEIRKFYDKLCDYVHACMSHDALLYRVRAQDGKKDLASKEEGHRPKSMHNHLSYAANRTNFGWLSLCS
jgi:recombinational DNA repair ATPase RecF